MFHFILYLIITVAQSPTQALGKCFNVNTEIIIALIYQFILMFKLKCIIILYTQTRDSIN